jgi:predicted short-subunit dehydrogenase-like oxidoreductase (DUF2520 family)
VVSVCRRDPRRAGEAARLVGRGTIAHTDPVLAAAGANVVFLTVRDHEIAGLAQALSGDDVAPSTLYIHCAGALSASVLAPLKARGASTAALHPLQTFAGGSSGGGRPAGQRLAGVRWFHDGDALTRCRALVRATGGKVSSLDPAARSLYHAAAVAASNYLVVVEDLATRLAEAAGIPRDDALAGMLPLVEGTVANLRRVGLPAALTGPVTRGDAATVRAHRRALASLGGDLDSLYAALGRHALVIARERGLDEAAARRMAAALR